MPFNVIGGLAAALASRRTGYARLRGVTAVGGPFVTRKAAEDHRSTYIPAAHRHSEEMLGLTLPAASYSVVEGCNLVEALCAALELPGHRSSRDDVTPNEPRSSSKLQENSSSLPDTSLSTKLR